jgi:HK97 gp10 family phage protein
MNPLNTGFYTGEGPGAISGEIKLQGFDELEKILAGLAGNDGLDIIRKSLRLSAEAMRKEAVRRAPQDTGELKRNIRLRVNRRSGYSASYQIYVKRSRTQKNKTTGKRERIGGAWYAHFLEFGVKSHMVPKRKESYRTKLHGRWVTVTQFQHPGMRPHPFMRPTFDETQAATINRFGSNTIGAIQNYFRGNPVGMGMAEISAGVL